MIVKRQIVPDGTRNRTCPDRSSNGPRKLTTVEREKTVTDAVRAMTTPNEIGPCASTWNSKPQGLESRVIPKTRTARSRFPSTGP